MFSSISKSVAALIPRGPKALLASTIASALSTFFDVDEKAIESNLLSDTKIVLRDVKLRQASYKLGSALVRAEGLVEEVTFSWTWSLQGSSNNTENNLIQDATLMVRGLRLRITLQQWDDCDEAERLECISDCISAENQVNAKSVEEDGKKNQGYLQRCLQQVVDHLSVVINDFEFDVKYMPSGPMNPEANEGTTIVAVGTDVQLVTLKAFDNSDGSTALGQKLHVGSLSISTIDGTTHFPIIEEFGYSASVTRLAGQRFIGGIGSGLEVVGVPNPNSGVVVHAGIVQTKALCILTKLMVPSTEDCQEDDNNSSPDKVSQHTVMSKSSSEEDKPGASASATSTIFILTLPPMSLILPNETKLTIPDATLSFSSDGQLFRLHGGEHGTGILVNDSPILQFGKHAEQSNSAVRKSDSVRWILDFVKSRFVIESIKIGASKEESSKTLKGSELAKLMCRKDQLRLVLQEFSELASSKDVEECATVLKSVGSHNEKGAKFEETTQSWSFHAKGILLIRMEETRNANDIHWIEAAVDSPSFEVSLEPSGTCAVTQIDCEGIQLNSCFFGTFSSQFDFLPESNTFRIVNGIDVSIQSLQVAQNLQSFLSDFLEEPANTPSAPEEKNETKLRPMDVSLEKLVLNIQEPLTKISVENTRVSSNNEATCAAIHLELENGVSASFTGVRAAFANPTAAEIQIQQIASLHIPEVLCLSKPILEVNAKFVEGVLRISAKSIYVQGFDTSKPNHQSISLATDGDNAINTWFPVQLVLDAVTIRKSEKDSTRLLMRRINLEVKPKGSSVEVGTRGQLVCRVITRSEKWTQIGLNETWLVLSNGGNPKEIRCAGIVLGPFSYGKCSASIPQVHATLSPNDWKMAVTGVVSIALESLDDLKKIQSVTDELVKTNPKVSQGSEQSQLFPFSLQVAEASITMLQPKTTIAFKSVSIDKFELRCDDFNFKEFTSGASSSISGIRLCCAPQINMQVDAIESADIPGVVCLSEPLRGLTCLYSDGTLRVEVGLARVALLETGLTNDLGSHHREASDFTLPFELSLGVKELELKISERCTKIVRAWDVGVAVRNSGHDVRICDTTSVRLEKSADEWIIASLHPLSISVGKDANSRYTVREMTFGGASIGPSSFGQVSISIPSLKLLRDVLSVDGIVEVSLESADLGGKIKRFVEDMVGGESTESNSTYKVDSSDEFEFSFTTNMSKIKLSIREPQAEVVVDGIVAQHGDVTCRSLHAITSQGVSATLSGLKADVSRPSSPRGEISFIENAFVPGFMSLSKPMENVGICFSDNLLQFNIPTINATILNDSTQGKPVENKSGRSNFSIPVLMHLVVQEVWLSRSKDKGQNWLSITHFDIGVHPTPLPKCSAVGVGVTVNRIGELRNELFQAKNIAASGLAHPDRLDVLQHFDFRSEIIHISPGFSSIEWSTLFGEGEGQDSSNSMKIPFAKVAGIKVQISYEGKLLKAKETTIDVPPFIGNANTTSQELTKFYSDSIMSRIPGIIANTEVLGTNVADSSFANVGRMASMSSVAGAGLGSVAGIAVLDSIKGAVKEGKQQRNSSQHEAYEFGDFTRGTLHSMKKASDLGGKLRRGQSKHYVPGDVTVGAATAATSYAKENSERLGSAGGGGVGMMVGAAVAGPIGLLAGAYLGGQAGKKAFEGEASPKEEQQTAISDLRISSMAPTQRLQSNRVGPRNSALVSREEDLLGLSLSASNLPHQNHQMTNSGANPMNQNLATQSNFFRQENRDPLQARNKADGNLSHRQFQSTVKATPAHNHVNGQESHTFNATPTRCQPSSPVPDLLSFPAQSTSDSTGSYIATSQVTHSQNRNFGQVPGLHDQGRTSGEAQYRNHGGPPFAASRNTSGRPPTTHAAYAEQDKGYQFGDITKSIISRGKQKEGRDKKSGYKFGDFTRGLLG